MRLLSTILTILTVLILPLSGVAQEKVEQKNTLQTQVQQSLSDEQIMLNNIASKAVIEGKYSHAEHLFSAMLAIQEFNLTWLQLGKTYAHQNKCMEAYDAFDHVATAPIIDVVPAEEINTATQNALSELDAQCTAKAVFICSPEEMFLSIDGGNEFKCRTTPVPLTPGKHSVLARTGIGINTSVISLQHNETKNFNIEIFDYNCGLPNFPEPVRYAEGLFKYSGWGLFGSDLALTTVGTSLLFASGNKVNNKIAASALITPGGAALIASIGLLISNAVIDYHSIYGYGYNTDCGGCYCEALGFMDIIKDFRAWGWGLFGSGLGLSIIGTHILFADDIGGNKDNNKITTSSLVSLGGVTLLTGIGLLIIDAYKFNYYNPYFSLQFQPEFFASPQMSGFGISGSF